MENANTVETRGVLAGCYKGGRKSLKALLTHAVEISADGTELRTFCRLPVDSVADHYSDEAGLADAPTCKTCARRDPRAAKAA